MIVPPCKDCQNRHILCHATCEKYAEFRQQVDYVQNERKKYAESKDFWFDEKRALRSHLKKVRSAV